MDSRKQHESLSLETEVIHVAESMPKLISDEDSSANVENESKSMEKQVIKEEAVLSISQNQFTPRNKLFHNQDDGKKDEPEEKEDVKKKVDSDSDEDEEKKDNQNKENVISNKKKKKGLKAPGFLKTGTTIVGLIFQLKIDIADFINHQSQYCRLLPGSRSLTVAVNSLRNKERTKIEGQHFRRKTEPSFVE
ncbi:unnamed protein product [Arabis nemorensis]|uniref:Uncharacterized protein n=1 Tax=Arabis nemorensis TaxID=586526 RepID=A0A565BHL1_9BRAS|nr:unnamed protein product [Arabis nemorensis]